MIYAAPILVFLLLVAPGLRLLALASRTRRTPELWCGLYFVGAAIGLSLRVAGASFLLEDPARAEQLNVAGHLGLASGTIAMAIFTLQVFHPGHVVARFFAATTIGLIIATSCHTLLGGWVLREDSLSMIATNALRIVPTAWAFYESFRYWRSMRRRLALGLADPVVTNRFLLWTIWSGGVSLLPLIALSLRVLSVTFLGSEGYTTRAAELLPPAMAAIRILFLLIVPMTVTALFLSFFPPKRYLDRIREGSASANSANSAADAV